MDIRARTPDHSGFAEHDSQQVHYEVFGDGDPTIVLIHGIPVVHSGIWRGTVPVLARDRRVITIDLLGNGQSDRPTDPAAYALPMSMGLLGAVLTATDTTRRVLVGSSAGAVLALVDAAFHPDDVAGVVLLASSAPVAGPPPGWAGLDITTFDDPPAATHGWGAVRRDLLVNDYDNFVRFFFAQVFPEPHTSKVKEDCLRYASGTSGEVIAACFDGMGATNGTWTERAERMRPLLEGVKCPALVIHGSADRIAPVETAVELATQLDAALLVVDGGGHALAKEAVQVNLAIRGFLDKISPPRRVRRWTTMATGRPRILYLSSPIGLGHVHRDIAIATALRGQMPDLQVDWLAQEPITRVLERRGEALHPASEHLARELTAFEQGCDEHAINAFRAFRRTDDVQLANFHVFADVIAEGGYDAVVADEAWEADLLLHDNPDLKRSPFIWLTDFVGVLPAPGGPDADVPLIADVNAEMLEQRARYPRLRDLSLFVGNPDDLVDLPLGPDLPTVKAWTTEHFRFTGYVLGTPPVPVEQRQQLRATLGYRDGEQVCIVTAGGSRIGVSLLTRAAQAYPELREEMPQLRMIVVTGPRIEKAQIAAPPGVEVRGYVPDLAQHLAVCDAAIVQGGLSTCMELAANQRPFVYVPLQRHFEQQIHVAHRLANYRAGERVDWPGLNAESIAAALTAQRRPSRPVETNGAETAASAICELIG